MSYHLITYAEQLASQNHSTYLERHAKWKHENATYKQLQWLSTMWWTKGLKIKTKFDVHTTVKANKISWIVNKSY
jgi:hypothetical protein